MSDYYRCSLGSILRTALPSAFLLTSETTVSKIAEVEVDWETLSDDAFLVMEALEKSDLLIEDIQAIVQRQHIAARSNVSGIGLCTNSSIPEREYSPKYHRYFRIHPDHQDEAALNQLFEQLKRAPNRVRSF